MRLALLSSRFSPDTPSDSRPQSLPALNTAFLASLQDLSAYHIFQWSTFYRDIFTRFFGDYVDAALTFGVAQTADSIRLPLTSHSREIFTKGYRYVTVESGESMQFAVTKSLNGLQRFLDLPLEFYSTRLVAAANEPASARALRAVCSSMVSAILTGYATLELGELTGAQALPRFSRSWSHAISFMNGADLERVLESLEPGDFRKAWH